MTTSDNSRKIRSGLLCVDRPINIGIVPNDFIIYAGPDEALFLPNCPTLLTFIVFYIRNWPNHINILHILRTRIKYVSTHMQENGESPHHIL